MSHGRMSHAQLTSHTKFPVVSRQTNVGILRKGGNHAKAEPGSTLAMSQHSSLCYLATGISPVAGQSEQICELVVIQARSTSPVVRPSAGPGKNGYVYAKKIDTSEATASVNEFLTFLHAFLRLGAQ